MLTEAVKAISRSKLGRGPDLENPSGYNDKIAWLKLHDQRPEQITACDKWAVRDMVEAAVGPEVLIPATRVYPPRRLPCVVKATHDSGSSSLVRSEADMPAADQRLRTCLGRTYGVNTGEWAYRFVTPKVIVERLMSEKPVDYKFHCSDGRVLWVQVIWNRHTGKASEAILLPDGSVTALHMDEKMTHNASPTNYPGDRAWSALSALARRLSEGWRYVRVDLYWFHGSPYFGELTFWPRAGCYRSNDEPVFGDMLDIDLTTKLPPIVA